MILSGFFLRIGLLKSSKSSVVSTGNDFAAILLVLERLHTRIFWMIEYPAITVTSGSFGSFVGGISF